MLISYAHDNADHEEAVYQFWRTLRDQGVDAKIDLTATATRQIWTEWMTEQVREADYVLVMASPAYRDRAENRGDPAAGRGVRWESRLLQELLFADPDGGFRKVLPVVLPGRSVDELPAWVQPMAGHTYRVAAIAPAGLEELLRVLTGQPLHPEPALGDVPVLPPRTDAAPSAAPAGTTAGLVDALLAVPGMLEPAFRQKLYDGLPPQIAQQLHRDGRARLELVGLVDVFRGYPHLRPWQALVTRLEELVPDHPSVRAVAGLVAGFSGD
ncbi:hypothetical protein GCM10010170_110200 [Dactylosporangium salmoneum]|uniref:SEFIR domain-containing protein n=1 Tax=Dactylosporangium salmoneum TaxID=53361 RepID=A0ABN3I5L5_9ACTN